MWIITIAQLLIEWQADDKLRACSFSRLREVIGDRGVVGRGAQKHFQRQLLTQLVRGVTIVFIHLSKYPIVIFGVGHHGD